MSMNQNLPSISGLLSGNPSDTSPCPIRKYGNWMIKADFRFRG